jgi:hypothetical protein
MRTAPTHMYFSKCDVAYVVPNPIELMKCGRRTETIDYFSKSLFQKDGANDFFGMYFK